MENCARQMASCILDPACLGNLTCPSSCSSGGEFTAGTCVFECTQAAAKSTVYVEMLTCWGETIVKRIGRNPVARAELILPGRGNPLSHHFNK